MQSLVVSAKQYGVWVEGKKGRGEEEKRRRGMTNHRNERSTPPL
jgi:hypothetical protein